MQRFWRQFGDFSPIAVLSSGTGIQARLKSMVAQALIAGLVSLTISFSF